jgi:hypothetical protein
MQRQKLETTKNKFLRNAAGCTLKDQVRKTVISSDVNILKLSNSIQNDRLNWIYHVETVELERVPNG